VNAAKSTALIIPAKRCRGDHRQGGLVRTRAESRNPGGVRRQRWHQIDERFSVGSGPLRTIQLEPYRRACMAGTSRSTSSPPYGCIRDADDLISKDHLDPLIGKSGSDWHRLADDVQLTTGSEEALGFDGLLAKHSLRSCGLTLSDFALGNLPRENRYRCGPVLKPLVPRSFLTAPDPCDITWRRGERSAPSVALLTAVGIQAKAASTGGGLAV
jgi:hypothetical protein